MMQGQPPTNLNADIDIKKLDDVVCDECGGNTFRDVVLLKYVSGLLTDHGKPGYIPIPTWACNKCGHVNDKLNPLKQIITKP